MDDIRVMIAEKDSAALKSLKDILTRAGYIVIGEADDGVTATKMVREIQPEIVLASINLPVINGIELARIIEEDRLAAVILIADYAEKNIAYKHSERLPGPILIKPVDELNLLSMIEYTYATFNKVAALEREVVRLKSGLETRKIVERAKGILMKNQGLTEEEAFKRIQQQSMKKRTTMKKIAEAIIMTYEMSN